MADVFFRFLIGLRSVELKGQARSVLLLGYLLGYLGHRNAAAHSVDSDIF